MYVCMNYNTNARTRMCQKMFAAIMLRALRYKLALGARSSLYVKLHSRS